MMMTHLDSSVIVRQHWSYHEITYHYLHLLFLNVTCQKKNVLSQYFLVAEGNSLQDVFSLNGNEQEPDLHKHVQTQKHKTEAQHSVCKIMTQQLFTAERRLELFVKS